MDIRVESGRLLERHSGAIVAGLYEGEEELTGACAQLDTALAGGIQRLRHEGDITGKRDEFTLVYTFDKLPSPRLIVAGLGKRSQISTEVLRNLAGSLARFLRRHNISDAVTETLGPVGGLGAEAAGQAIAEGALLGLYTFDLHKFSTKPGSHSLHTLTIVVDEGQEEAVRAGVQRGIALAEATNLARDLENEPSNYMTPTDLASRAREVADETGLECQVLDREDMVELGMGALLGVAKGSHEEPKFIVLSYRGDPGTDRAIGLVGKGITFDSGGISIKPAQGMEAMKGDMSGGATVIAVMQAIGRLKPNLNVTGIVPATENMPGGDAIKPGDVLVAMSGKTIEVISTDAEGRLILSDGISYARRLELSPIIDIATLTGAVRVALGDVAIGVMGNDDELVGELIRAGKTAGEKLWQLPLFEEYREQIKSDVADIKNSGGRNAGSITAGWFLAEFAGETPWAHLDMAGVSIYERERGWRVKGASGIPVRTLINFILARARVYGSLREAQTATADG